MSGRADEVRSAGIAFLIAAAALFAQVLVHRLIAAKLLNNFAFLVISLTMLGFAVAGVVLTRALPAVLARRDEYVAAFGAAFGLTLLGASAVFCHLPAGLQFVTDTPTFVRTLLTWLPAALLFAVPFGFAGLILGALLADPRLPARVIYGADLVGSALGALVVIPAIRHLGVERSLALCAAVTLALLLAAARPRRPATYALSAAAVAVIALSVARPDVVFPIRVRPGSVLDRSHGDGFGLEYAQWDPVARIEISRVHPPIPEQSMHPLLLSERPEFLARFKRVLTQNDYAYSYMVEYDGRRESLEGIGDTIYAAAYQATSVPHPRVVVIGVGGGFDLLTALYFDAARVTGVEVNGATLDILRRVFADYFRAWVTDPRVTLVEDDGRHFLAAQTDARYDVIQLSGVDSYAGTPGAAHVFSESYLYTAEAFDLYLSRLSEDGIVNMMRLEYIPPREMLRALATAVASLRRAGIADPARHVVMLSGTRDNFTALLVKKAPFTAAEVAKLDAWAAATRTFYVSAAPDANAERKNMYELFLSLGTPAREAGFVRAYAYDVSPATDDRPFFFNYSFWSDLPKLAPTRWPFMQVTVLLLVVLVAGAAVACVYLPLRFLASGERPAGASRATLYFASIAVGYMAVEIALLQKFGVFLGHPNYALSVVLSALLLSTGAGALASSALVRVLGRLRFVSYTLAFLILVFHVGIFPRLMGWVALPFAVRAAVVFVLVAPVGMLLGVFMPWGLDRLKASSPALAPWAWGINGIFSVLAPVVSVAFAMSWGSGALMLTAVPAYLAAAFAFDRDRAPRPA